MKDQNLVFTMWQNDLVILKLWLKYYSPQFERVVVHCFNTRDDIFEELKKLKDQYPNMDIERFGSFDGHNIDGDPRIASKYLQAQQRHYLESYGWVLFANCDEIVAVDGVKYKSLKELMGDPALLVVPCEAYEVVQNDNDALLEYDKPIFKQRKLWIKNPNYNKILLSRIPLEWNEGLHKIDQITQQQSQAIKGTGLYLIHLKHADIHRQGDFGPYNAEVKFDPNIHIWKRKKIPAFIKTIL